jgi:hypothetical protein
MYAYMRDKFTIYKIKFLWKKEEKIFVSEKVGIFSLNKTFLRTKNDI